MTLPQLFVALFCQRSIVWAPVRPPAPPEAKPSNLIPFPEPAFYVEETQRWRRGDLLMFSDRPWTRVKPINNAQALHGRTARALDLY